MLIRIVFLIVFILSPAGVAQQARYDPRHLSSEQIAAEQARRREYYRLEGERRELAVKRGLVSQARMLNANQSDYDVKYYGIHVNINFTTESIVAAIDYQIESLVSNLAVVDLDLVNQLTVDSVKVNGQTAVSSHLGSTLSITLPVPQSAGQEFSMNVYYHGQPYSGYGYTDGGMGFMNNNGNLVCWTATEPFGSRNWWPCKDTPEDKADSVELWIECPSTMTAATNGVMLSNTDLGGGRRLFHWKHRYPITTYLVALSVANFVIDQNTWNYDGHSMPVYSYAFPNAWNYITLFDTLTIPMLNIYSDAFGIYPFVNEKLANVNCGIYGTMEHQTCSFHDPFSFYDPEYLLIHENAHQWWGDMITCKTFHHIWINEGFGTFSEAIFYEGAYGSLQAYLNHMQTLKYMGEGTIYVEDPLTEVIFDGNLSYAKGAWVVHMLRGALGDSTFFRAIKEWTGGPFRYGSATTEDLSASISTSVGRDMSWFFNEWIYGNGHPSYEYSWQCSPDPAGGYNLDFCIEQIQQLYPLFQMPVRLHLSTTGGARDTSVFNQWWEQVYRIHLTDSVTAVQFDPQQWILRDAVQVPFTMHAVTTVCPDAELGVPYYLKFEAVGGVEPYHWNFWGGDLPYGLQFDDDTVGVLSGTPGFEATFYFTLQLLDSSVPQKSLLQSYSLTVGPPATVCGDADNSGVVSISDAVYLINYIFAGGPAPNTTAADADCSSSVSISDAVYLINYIFAGGPAPCAACP